MYISYLDRHLATVEQRRFVDLAQSSGRDIYMYMYMYI